MGKYVLSTICFLLAALLPSVAAAAGLGRLNVLSSLGQPLRAEIEIVSLQPGEGETLSAALAPQQAFRQANIELNSALLDVRFAVERRAGGQHFLVLSSTRPMNEPFLDMLVQLSWSGGRLVREYTFLLDPPEYRGSAVAQATPPATPPAAQPLPAPAPAPRREAAVPAEAASAAAPGTYQVKRGDTLARIARDHMPQGVTLQQMLAALYRSNQDAFMGNNMNRLRAGPILNIPDRETALSIGAEEARRLVNSQGADYAEYQRSIGAAVAAAPARAEATRQSSGRITAPSEQQAGAAKEPPRDQLRLSKPDEARAGKAAAASGDDRVAADKALRDAQERVAALEKNVQELQRLLALKSAPGAQAQQQAQASQAAPAAPAAGKPAPAPAQPAKAAPAQAAKAGDTKGAPADAAKGAPADVAKAAPAADAKSAPAPEAGKAPDVAKAAPKAPRVVPPPPPPEKDFIDELLENEYALGAAALVVLLLAGYGVIAWRRRKQEAEQRFGPSLIGPSLSVPSSVLGSAGAHSVDTASSAAQMDFSGGVGAKTDSEEIDPVAEADVYMAYGRDAQAEEILKEALAKDPGRNDVRLKLLEVYANRKDARAFEAAARELQKSTGGQGPDWEKVLVLGKQVDPANPLYGGAAKAAEDTQVFNVAAFTAAAAATEPPAEAAPPLDFDLDLGSGAAPAQPDIRLEAAPAQPDINLDAPAPRSDQAVSIDFDLDLGAPAAEAPAAEKPAGKPEAPPASEAGGGLDFDLGLAEAPAAAQAPEPAEEKPAAAEEGRTPEPVAQGNVTQGNVIDFDLNLGDEPAPKEAQAEPPRAEPAKPAPLVPDFDLSSISLDLGSESPQPAAVDARWQEVATKLDLAKAYEEMGDKDGARDLLNEVVKEGDSTQQQQAKTMLTALG